MQLHGFRILYERAKRTQQPCSHIRPLRTGPSRLKPGWRQGVNGGSAPAAVQQELRVEQPSHQLYLYLHQLPRPYSGFLNFPLALALALASPLLPLLGGEPGVESDGRNHYSTEMGLPSDAGNSSCSLKIEDN